MSLESETSIGDNRDQRRPRWSYLLLACLVFLGGGAIYGGVSFVLDPTGGMLGIPLEWIQDSPFDTFLIPGIFLLIASLGEEIGWRGLALPALEGRHGAFWLLLDTFSEFGVGYLLLNYLFVLPGAFYITWIYNHGRFSLLLVVMFHVTFNIVNVAWLPVTTSLGAFGIVIAINWIIAIPVSRRLEPAYIGKTYR